MKTVLVWGFYHQGNIGDDVMACMVYEMLEEMGHKPIIYTKSSRLSQMGYRCTSRLWDVEANVVVLGGGAFFKEEMNGNSKIEAEIELLYNYIAKKTVNVIGVSLGSDGITNINQASSYRKAVARSDLFKTAAVRISGDLNLGLNSCEFIPDIVLLTKLCAERYSRLNPKKVSGGTADVLINLSRRSAAYIPLALYKSYGKKTAFFRAHTGRKKTGGEITLPFFSEINTESINESLWHIKECSEIISSKLHPGVIAISFGNKFTSVAPRPKTKAFLSEVRPNSDVDLFNSYMNFLSSNL